MSVLTLVRHAQASFHAEHAEHYDQLSTLGKSQARALGESWVQQQRIVNEVYVGPRARQQQTAKLVAKCYRHAGLSFPEPIVLPELDEYDLDGLLLRLAPKLAQQDSEFARLWGIVRSGDTEQERERNFQNVFEPLMFHWLAMDEAIDGLESWLMFRGRVQRALQYIINQPGGRRRVVVFTSGGFIGTAVQIVTNAPDKLALEINWRVRNGSATEFVFSEDRVTLDGFNSVAHFSRPELITFR